MRGNVLKFRVFLKKGGIYCLQYVATGLDDWLAGPGGCFFQNLATHFSFHLIAAGF